MKKFIPFFACIIIFTSCQHSKQEFVKDLIKANNNFEIDKISRLLSDDFIYYWADTYWTDTLNKADYLSRIDNFKSIEFQSSILQIQDFDSIVMTEEMSHSIIDSLLGVTPAVIQKKTYRFIADKLTSISVDSTLNYEEYTKSFYEKYLPFAFYIKEQYGIEDEKEITANLKKYLLEYIGLSASERKQYKNYAHLQGTYVSQDCAFYRELVFKGKRTVTIVDAIFGFSFPSSYELDEDIIRIRTDKSDLLFTIKDSQTLIGEGFARGTFRKSN